MLGQRETLAAVWHVYMQDNATHIGCVQYSINAFLTVKNHTKLKFGHMIALYGCIL